MRSQDGLSESAAKDLLSLLLERGYFHQHVEPQLADEDSRNDHRRVFSEMDPECQLVSTQDGCYMTRTRLQLRLQEELSAKGRMSIENAAVALAVDRKHIEQAVLHTGRFCCLRGRRLDYTRALGSLGGKSTC